MRKRYSGFNFFVDAVFTMCSGGLWLAWVLFRESRNGLAR